MHLSGSSGSDGGDAVNRFLTNIVTWLRSGYPNGVPQNDYLPILALLSRRLTADEIIEIARQLQHLPEPVSSTSVRKSCASPTNYPNRPK